MRRGQLQNCTKKKDQIPQELKRYIMGNKVYKLDFQKSPSSDFIWRGTKDFSNLIATNFTDPKTGRCAWTIRVAPEKPLGIKLSLTSTKRIENVTCGSNSNMGSIAKAMKDALVSTGYSELCDYQRKIIEAYFVGEGCFCVCSNRSWQESDF